VFRGPKSFTGEDVVEFQCHGGPVSSARILRRLMNAGCRPAGPGEFSRRAFLNGRIDLTQAEAILDLIRAHSDRAATAAIEQLDGELGRTIETVYARAMSATAAIEAALDFPEEDTADVPTDEILTSIRWCAAECERLSSTWYEGHLLRDGLRIVIAGRPNVGKSSVFNLLAGRDRAITSSTPGTTRDTIEEWLAWSGHGICLVDTAGLRSSDCPIEMDGVKRSHKELSIADLWIYVIESHRPPEPEDLAFLNRADCSHIVLLANKMDLGISNSIEPLLPNHRALFISAMDTSFRALIIDRCLSTADQFCRGVSNNSSVAVSERHKELLNLALPEFQTSASILQEGPDDSLVRAASHMRTGLEALGKITGRIYSDDLLDGIFSKFCIGK
jgi:tRNA modification GTPase